MKINDWLSIQSLFDEMNKRLDRCQKYQNVGVPRSYVRMLVELEDFLVETLANKDVKKKMSKTNAQALNTMRQRVKKHTPAYAELLAKFRENPESTEEEPEEESEEEVESEQEGDEGSDAEFRKVRCREGVDRGGHVASIQMGSPSSAVRQCLLPGNLVGGPEQGCSFLVLVVVRVVRRKPADAATCTHAFSQLARSYEHKQWCGTGGYDKGTHAWFAGTCTGCSHAPQHAAHPLCTLVGFDPATAQCAQHVACPAARLALCRARLTLVCVCVAPQPQAAKKKDKLMTMDPKEITYEMVNKKLREIMMSRGRRGTDKAEQVGGAGMWRSSVKAAAQKAVAVRVWRFFE